MRRLFRDEIFFVFQPDGAPAHREHNIVLFPGARETRRRLSACFRVHAAYNLEHEF